MSTSEVLYRRSAIASTEIATRSTNLSAARLEISRSVVAGSVVLVLVLVLVGSEVELASPSTSDADVVEVVVVVVDS